MPLTQEEKKKYEELKEKEARLNKIVELRAREKELESLVGEQWKGQTPTTAMIPPEQRGRIAGSTEMKLRGVQEEIGQKLPPAGLISQLGGRIPTDRYSSATALGAAGPVVPVSPTADKQKSLAAIKTLRDMGISDERINTALKIQRLSEKSQRGPSKAPQMAGATAGSFVVPAAAAMLGVTNPLALSVLFLAGSFAGGASGKGYQIVATTPEQSLGESALQQFKAGSEEAAYDLFGLLLTKGLGRGYKAIKGATGKIRPYLRRQVKSISGKKTLAPVRSRIDVDVAELKELLARGASRAEVEAFLTRSMEIDSALWQNMEVFANEAIIGSGQYKKLISTKLPRAIEGSVDITVEDFAKKLGRNLTPAEVAGVLRNTLNDGRAAWRLTEKAMWNMPGLQKAGDVVDIGFIHKFSTKTAGEAAKVGGAGLGPGAKSALGMIDDIPANRLSVPRAQTVLSDLKARLRDHQSVFSKDSRAAKIVSDLIDKFETAVETAAKKLNSAEFKQYQRAKWYTRAGHQRYDNELVKHLVDVLKPIDKGGRPDLLMKTVFTNGKPEQVKYIKKLIMQRPDGKEVWNQLKFQYLGDLITASEAPATAEFLGKKFLANLKKGQGIQEIAFTKEELKSLYTLGDLAKRTQMKPKGAKIMASMVQAQVVISMPESLTGGREVKKWQVVLALTPVMMGTIIANPRNIKLFMQATVGGSLRAAREFIAVAERQKKKTQLEDFVRERNITQKDSEMFFKELKR